MTHAPQPDLDRWLEDLRSEYWGRLSRIEDSNEASGIAHVVFGIARTGFAVDARLCKGVVRKPQVTRLPRVPPHILGIAGIRGQVVSVTDPAVLLGVPGPREPGTGFLLMISCAETRAALWVDRVSDVVSLREEELLPVETPWPGSPPGVVMAQRAGTEPRLLVLDGRRYLEASAVDNSFVG